MSHEGRRDGDDVEGDNLVCSSPSPSPRGGVVSSCDLRWGISRPATNSPMEERERDAGRQDDEFDLERDNERIGIKIQNLSSPELETGSDVRDQKEI